MSSLGEPLRRAVQRNADQRFCLQTVLCYSGKKSATEQYFFYIQAAPERPKEEKKEKKEEKEKKDKEEKKEDKEGESSTKEGEGEATAAPGDEEKVDEKREASVEMVEEKEKVCSTNFLFVWPQLGNFTKSFL